MKNLTGAGFIVFILGAVMADSASFIPTIVCMICGAILMMAGKKYV
jgi:hypothetical protein